MIGEYEYDRANMCYSRGQITFAELIAVIKGTVLLDTVMEERTSYVA